MTGLSEGSVEAKLQVQPSKILCWFQTGFLEWSHWSQVCIFICRLQAATVKMNFIWSIFLSTCYCQHIHLKAHFYSSLARTSSVISKRPFNHLLLDPVTCEIFPKVTVSPILVWHHVLGRAARLYPLPQSNLTCFLFLCRKCRDGSCCRSACITIL